MFNADDVVISLRADEILQYVSEEDIFKRYCNNFQEINKAFCSDLYDDKHPSCRIQYMQSGMLIYKDFGKGGHTCNCFKYVMIKYNCTYRESLNIIANDFGLLKLNSHRTPLHIIPKELILVESNKPKKSYITIEPRSWNLTDYNYWTNQYGISFDLLEEYDVIPCKTATLVKSDKSIVFYSTLANPIYAYKFVYDGVVSYKIYKPLEPNKKYKWLFSGGTKENIEGFDQLPYFADLLIITKSLKDVIMSKLCGYPAISLQGEANKLEKNLAEKLQYRFKKCILLYDNDEQGIKSANSISSEYGFKSIIIPLESGCKDLSEFVAKNGLNEAKNLLNKLINENIAL